MFAFKFLFVLPFFMVSTKLPRFQPGWYSIYSIFQAENPKLDNLRSLLYGYEPTWEHTLAMLASRNIFQICQSLMAPLSYMQFYIDHNGQVAPLSNIQSRTFVKVKRNQSEYIQSGARKEVLEAGSIFFFLATVKILEHNVF